MNDEARTRERTTRAFYFAVQLASAGVTEMSGDRTSAAESRAVIADDINEAALTDNGAITNVIYFQSYIAGLIVDRCASKLGTDADTLWKELALEINRAELTVTLPGEDE